jgi:GNAT superfamily N-acetyltransferase
LDYTIRKAVLSDRAAIQELIAASARGLSRTHYDDSQIEAAISSVFGVDTDLIDDETYFVAEGSSGQFIGCGGWSRRRTLYGGDQFGSRDSEVLDPGTDPARIRAFFVHPDFSRQGIGRAIPSLCESDAQAHGFQSLELMATLPGIALYEACGYLRDEPFELELGQDIKLPLVKMYKRISFID